MVSVSDSCAGLITNLRSIRRPCGYPCVTQVLAPKTITVMDRSTAIWLADLFRLALRCKR